MTKSKGKKNVHVGEELKIAVTLTLQNFLQTEDQKECEFPSSLLSGERAFIHQMAMNMGLKSKSRGKGANRFLTVYKKEGSTIVQADAVFQLGRTSRQHVITLLQRFPVTNKERQDLVPLSERDRLLVDEGRELNRLTGRLNNGIAQIPPARGSSDYSAFRESLPMWQMREEIISAIDQHQVVLIAGETGSGKTTQVPQFILDDYYMKRKPVRIISTQPRRIAALTVAERVAAERGDKIGMTVGYQIRLESRVSPKTLLTFCTNGVFLRTLMGGDAALSTVTHIIVDEIHERDRYSDFLLIILRDALAKFRNLKLVLMSAVIDIQLFLKYFNGCPVITVPGKMYDVQEIFLEDILKCTGYMSKAMIKFKNEKDKKKKQVEKLNEWCSKVVSSPPKESTSSEVATVVNGSTSVSFVEANSNLAAMDKYISEAWLHGSENAFSNIMCLLANNENISVDHRHGETGVTPLMVAIVRGQSLMVEQLLNMGANVDIRSSNDLTALDWARNLNQNDIVEILEAHIIACESMYSNMSDLLSGNNGKDLSEEERELLDVYHHSFDDEKVDIDLIYCILQKICSCSEEGALLVFLPGYDEIVKLRDKIVNDEKNFFDPSKFMLFMLHSYMHSIDQKQVFRPAPRGLRKIILATNIAETSVTFNDIVFVIDSGKVKEKFFDAISGVSSLKSVWISKASSVQRKGRAGRCRPGICYRLYSRIRYRNMQEFQQPEILRVPLQDLCLHTKLLAPPNTPIADFLARAPDAPAFMVTRNAVQLLKTIDALDSWECLTELGHHLVDLPIDPRLGKMILYAVVLKCLDPILTIACALAYKEPFILPTCATDKKSAKMSRKMFAASTFSDHMALLRAFQAWQKASSDGCEKMFCEKHFISSSTMEMIVGMRTQLLGQLRASGFVRARGGGDIRDLNANSENWAVVKAALVAGTYPNLIRVDRERMRLITQKESKVRLHPSCVMAEMSYSSKTPGRSKNIESLPSDWLVYEEMSRTGHIAHARCCAVVSPISIVIFAGPSRLPLDALSENDVVHGDGYNDNNSDSEFEEKDDGQKSMLKLDDWISFKVDTEAAHLALQLRQKWHTLFLRRIRFPTKPLSQMDEAVIKTIISVVSVEEQALGLHQPCGIGQRPRPVSTDYLTCTTLSVRHNSLDAENSDDSSVNGDHAYFAPRIQSKSIAAASPKIKETAGQKGSDERSDSSSVRSTSSACGSSPISPCRSPTLSGSSSEKDVASAAANQNRYVVIKANSQKSIEVSMSKGVWVFSASVEKRLQKFLQEGKVVFLVFSVQGSGHFQGYSCLTSEIVHEKIPELSLPNLGHAYKIHWIKRGNIPFQSTRHLQNPWNENRKVQISRDGQELEPTIGEALCKLWDRHQNFVPKSSFLAGHAPSADEATAAGNKTEYERQQGQRHQFQMQQQFVGRPIRGYQHQQCSGMSSSAPAASANAFNNAFARSGSQGPSGVQPLSWSNQIQSCHGAPKT